MLDTARRKRYSMVVVHDVFATFADEDSPVMLARLEQIDLIALDAAVSADRMGERARRLLANRQHMAPERLPRLLITAHNDREHQLAQRAAQHLHSYVVSVTVLDERGRNETAVNALALHRKYWPNISEQERKTRIMLLGRRGGGG